MPASDNLQSETTRVLNDRRDAGSTTAEMLSWAAMLVVAIVAISAALQALGLNIVQFVGDQLGV